MLRTKIARITGEPFDPSLAFRITTTAHPEIAPQYEATNTDSPTAASTDVTSTAAILA